MTISTITIGGNDYTSYASVAEANIFLAVDAARATTWAAKTDDEKGALLVQATRRLNVLPWGGSKTGGDSQADAFPRTGLTYASGGSVATDEVPQSVEDATILIAGDIALDSDAGEVSTSGSNVKSVKGGTAEVQFFRRSDGVALQDETAYALVKQFLESASGEGSSVGNTSSGTDTNAEYANSVFEDRDAWGRTVGFP